VKYPGRYTLRRKDERLSELLERAGGVTQTAYLDGFQLLRNQRPVGVNLADALKNANNYNNVILLPGDSLVMPEYNGVVMVQGAVGSPTSVLYRKGAPLDYYIGSAGGYAHNADKGRVSVRYANGSGETVRRVAVFFHDKPLPTPGSTVTVPFRLPEDKTDVRGLVADVAQIAASLGAVVLAITRIN
jgi:protein involved in polysaccharide export with SLBB domain